MRILTLILFISFTNILFGQQKKYDTLFLANKSYLLEIGQGYQYAPYNFPFYIAQHHYKNLNTKKHYHSIDEYTCIDGSQYTASGNEVIAYKCKEYKKRQYLLDNFEDSLSVNLEDFGEIYIKASGKKYLIEKIQFKIVFDSTLLIINPDINQTIENFSYQIREALYKEKPKFIILNEMLYYDKKKKLQAIPRQFIITLD